MENKIKEILEYAIWAPSGDNSQPWEFQIENNKLKIFFIKDADNIFLNYKNGGTLIAHGCLLENIVIASRNFGLITKIEIPDNGVAERVTAIITFEVSDVCDNSLFEEIKKRHTNRKNYSSIKIDENIKENILNAVKDFPEVFFDIIEDEDSKKKLGAAGANAEIVILENMFLHGALFSDVVWNSKQERKKHKGLYVGSMEFNPVQIFLFWLASFWSLMRIVIVIGFPRFIAKEDSVKYASGAFLGIISTATNRKVDFINCGRLMQRIWLICSKNNLSFQPIIAMPFLYKMQAEDLLKDISLTKEHIDIINNSYTEIKNQIKDKNLQVNIMFRVGYADSASDRTSRFDLSSKFK